MGGTSTKFKEKTLKYILIPLYLGRELGENVIIGAGSIVLHDVESNEIIAGNPAKIVKNNGEN